MPLDKKKSKEAISHNIETETKAGKPHDQAVAIALHTAHPNEKGYADGGLVEAIMGLLGKKSEPLQADKKEAMTADNIDPVVASSTNTPSGYADGGLIQEEQPDAFYQDLGQGMTDGVNHDIDAVKEFLMSMYGKSQQGPIVEDSTLGTEDTGLQGLANKAAGTPSNAPARGYADGGPVEDTDFLNKLNNGTALTQPPIQFNPQAGMPPVPPPAAPPAPLNVNPSAITGYLGQQKEALNKYGPEQQMAVSNDILGRQNSLGGRLSNAGAGLADALMQGVARAGNPGFQANLQNRQDKQAELQLNALKGAREANVQNVEQGAKLDAMDPNSPQSKAAQASQGLFLSALGFDPKTISKMSAVQIPEAINTIKDLGIKDRELAVAKFKAQIEANALAETTKHNRTEESLKSKELGETAKQHGAENIIKGTELQSGQLEKLAAEPFMSRVAGMAGLNPAQQALEIKAGITEHPDDAAAIAYATDPKTRNTPQAARIRALHGIQ